MLVISLSFSFVSLFIIACLLVVRKELFAPTFDTNQTNNFAKIIWWICVGLFPEILGRIFFFTLYQGYPFLDGFSASGIFVVISLVLWNLFFEEILFRGVLWGILHDWNWSDRKIILIQAVLFWLVHVDLVTNVALGLPVLFFGIWVGFLTAHSKSLIPSMATHFFHNITSKLF